MATLEFSCPHCSASLDAPEEYAGSTVECPTCGKEFQLPGIESEEDAAAMCPSCGKEMEAGAVLCVHCGYHLKLQRRIETDFD